ncbi:MAG: di-trans,poly-cis-decaprenylcistransferase [Synergistaceae bacterium]|jgi:undecaprenyl diphosphate synthase|nr:di-trans,poly-cis-decaprenylcistransferase [Synergistaceae bacterium]
MPNGSVPRHVAIIMDGNGRWAEKRHLPRVLGHRKGVKALERVVERADAAGVEYLSAYAFSTENWKRSSAEVAGLMTLFGRYIGKKTAALKARHGRIRFAGRRDRLPLSVLRALEAAEESTKDETGLQFILCVDYGGRQEVVDAVKKIITSGVGADAVTEELLSAHMYLPDAPDPDLIIRTSGEERLSNFWLWTGAYSELYFTDTLWPDFDEAALDAALASYAGRQRRMGGGTGA